MGTNDQNGANGLAFQANLAWQNNVIAVKFLPRSFE
jgi:hypothetical protein